MSIALTGITLNLCKHAYFNTLMHARIYSPTYICTHLNIIIMIKGIAILNKSLTSERFLLFWKKCLEGIFRLAKKK